MRECKNSEILHYNAISTKEPFEKIFYINFSKSSILQQIVGAGDHFLDPQG